VKLILYLECGDRTRWDTEADGHPPPPSVDWVLDRCPACGEEDVLVVDTGPLTTRDVAEALGVSLRRAQALAKSRDVGQQLPDGRRLFSADDLSRLAPQAKYRRKQRLPPA